VAPGRISTRLRACACAVALALVAACGDASSADPGAEDHILDRSTARIQYRVGGLEGPGPGLGEQIYAAFDGSGRLHVLDASNHRTLTLGPTGALLREYGREGRGPGELSYPTGFGVYPDGRQVVADLGNRSLLTVDEDGTLAAEVKVPGESGFPAGSLLLLDGVAVAAPDPDVFSTAAAGDSLAWRIRSYGLARTESRVWCEAWRAPEPDGSDEPLTLGGRTLRVRVAGLTHLRAFWPRLHLTAAGDRIAVADSTTYRIRTFDRKSQPVGEIGRPIAPVTVTESFREAERARRRGLIDAGEGPRFQISGGDGSVQAVDQGMVDDFVKEQIEIMSFWPEAPVIVDLLGSPEGVLWVRRSGPDGQPRSIDLMEMSGEYVGTLPEGADFPLALGPDGLAAYREVSDLGVITLRVEVWTPDPGR